MELNDYSLRQMDENDIRKLPEGSVKGLGRQAASGFERSAGTVEPKFSEQFPSAGKRCTLGEHRREFGKR